jgi:hypothetical protein
MVLESSVCIVYAFFDVLFGGQMVCSLLEETRTRSHAVAFKRPALGQELPCVIP